MSITNIINVFNGVTLNCHSVFHLILVLIFISFENLKTATVNVKCTHTTHTDANKKNQTSFFRLFYHTFFSIFLLNYRLLQYMLFSKS